MQVHKWRIDRIQQVVYKNRRDLWYIAIIVEWLNGNHNSRRPPYTLHDKEYQHPSWWNLLYAMATKAGGNDYGSVEKIAKKQG